MSWLGLQVEAIERVFDPSVQLRAFGAPGESGDPVRIEHVARRIIKTYESLLDWAAGLRNVSTSDVFAEMVEAAACFVDQPIHEIRSFIDLAAEQISSLPELAANATKEEPVIITLELSVSIGDGVEKNFSAVPDRGILLTSDRENSPPLPSMSR